MWNHHIVASRSLKAGEARKSNLWQVNDSATREKKAQGKKKKPAHRGAAPT
jgi:hypothetical protein